MLRYLALLFIVLPIVDLWLLLSIGEVFGFWPTLVSTIAVAMLGAWLGKREGLRVVSQWKRALGELRMPEDGLVSGALVLVGAAFLMTPGVITDVLGLLLLFPPTRRVFAKLVSAFVAKRFARAAEEGRVRIHVSTVGLAGEEVAYDGDRGSPFHRADVVDTHGEESVPLLPENSSVPRVSRGNSTREC